MPVSLPQADQYDAPPDVREDNGRAMRIVSLLPSATEIVFALGLGDELVGRTHACDHPVEAADIPVVTSLAGPGARDAGRAVHDLITAVRREGSALHHLEMGLLTSFEPDLVLTQDICEVCAVSARDVSEAMRSADSDATVVSLDPESIEGILNSIATVGAFAEAEDEAVGLIEILREHLAAIEDRVLERRLQGIPARRIVVLEWLDPPFASGHWVPEMVRRAGGWELLGSEGERSVETSWDRVRQVDPEQVILALCGYDAARAAQELAAARLPAWFDELPAVVDGELFAVDGSGLFSRPGPRVIDGIALLAELFDPEGFAGSGPAHSWIPLGPVGMGSDPRPPV
ncbi:cobalamin-binding protein [soil metagenome]